MELVCIEMLFPVFTHTPLPLWKTLRFPSVYLLLTHLPFSTERLLPLDQVLKKALLAHVFTSG